MLIIALLSIVGPTAESLIFAERVDEVRENVNDSGSNRYADSDSPKLTQNV